MKGCCRFNSRVLAVLLGAVAPSARAAESWADPALPVKDGLELWFDASRLNAALAVGGAAALRNDDGISLFPDASGRRRDLGQPARAHSPLYQADLLPGKPLAVAHFDGADDHLLRSGIGAEFAEATAFVVAAPHSNSGGFRAFFSLAAAGQNDYRTGLNLDQGWGSSARFETVNAEGSGFSGQGDLLEGAYGFGTFHVLSLTAGPGEAGARLHVDGRPSGKRPRTAAAMRLDELRLGARYYSNTPAPPSTQNFFAGDLAEVILYGRALKDEERAAVEGYLVRKYQAFLKLPGLPEKPPFQLLTGGFRVRELPVKLTNVNDLLYEPSGRLLVLGYDGRIHALSDTDGDGLEDRVEPYWSQRTFLSPLAMALRPEGLYVSANKKVSLLRDIDGDGRADREEVVAEGWPQPEVPTGSGVDVLGIAFDAAGSLFFALGCADFTNAYRVKDGQARYRLEDERGTILKLSPDRKRREIVCTGTRFPCTLAFNRHGDLFATDQEGETWLPGGNPLDELLHVLPGRHYGFPPRHPLHLPGVVDEPAVLEFGPQHQSTCGLVWNEPRAGQGLFGPPSWEGDGFVAGYSRGKVWRVRCVKTPAGYIARASLFAALSLLTLDVAVTPAGDLLVACHSGSPDWGSGPGGDGRLFKVSQSDRQAPRPVLAWAEGPLEARVAFESPLDPAAAAKLAGRKIPFGEHVRAGDRFEVHRPGYASVEAQLRSPRSELRISGARLERGGRTLVLSTDPHAVRATYAAPLSGLVSAAGGPEAPLEVDYTLGGVQAAWEPAAGGPRESLWLPHLDLQAARELLRGSAEAEVLAGLLERPGRLKLVTKLALPRARHTLRLESTAPIESEPVAAGGKIELEAAGAEAVPLEIALETGKGGRAPELRLSLQAEGDPHPRPIPLAALLLPWASERRPDPPAAPAGPPPELEGGDWKRGQAVFASAEAKCSACHLVRGQGGTIGPDLSNLVHRDAASVLRDIAEPSAAIHPDYASCTVFLRDGRVLAGIVRAEGEDRLRLQDGEAKEMVLARADVRDLLPSSLSIMPQGVPQTLGAARLKDLLVFLLTAPPAEAGGGAGGGGALNLVLVAGPKDHGPGEHDYPAWQKSWAALLGKAPGVRVSTAWEWPERAHWDLADVVVFFFWNHDWSAQRYAELDRHLERGGGAVFLHSATIADSEPEALAERIGLAFQPGRSKYRHGPLELKVVAPKDDPITRGLAETVSLVDESYWPMVGDPARVQVLVTTVEEGKPWPMAWTLSRGKGRVFCTILGHYAKTFDDSRARLLMLRGIAWAAGAPAERLEALAGGKER